MKRLESSVPTLFLMANRLNILENIALAPMTTLEIGGKARFFVRADDEKTVIDAFEFAREHGFELFIIGGGSNVLIADEGFDGLVIQVAIKGIIFEQENARKMNVLAAAGEDWDSFVEICVDKNLQGVECLSGIPGFIGGTPIQNVGAYGQEVSESVTRVRCLDRKTGSIIELNNSECKFSYRKSIFNTTEKERFIVLSVKYTLNIDGEPNIIYADLRKQFDERIPSLKETRNEVLAIRASKSMVIDSNDPNSKSAGSFFKNPIVSKTVFDEIQKKARKLRLLKSDQSLPCYRVDDEFTKIPAAWLIENSGFHKGYVNGNAGLSTKHTLAITNLGNAKASDVLRLKDEIQKTVNDQFGILLIPEPILVGFK